MNETIKEVVKRVDELIARDDSFGKRVAYDLVVLLASDMEKAAGLRAEFELRLSMPGPAPEERGKLIEEIALKIESAAGRGRAAKELLDALIERLYGLDEKQSEFIANETGKKPNAER